MSVNRYQPHVLVLPEDDANRQVANGFILDPSILMHRIQVLEEAGGWWEVLQRFQTDHIRGMETYRERRIVLLIDFDGQPDRLIEAKRVVPAHLTDRVFILGAWNEPEDLKPSLGSFEMIGRAMAKDCREDTNVTWSHALLRHNADEVDRMRKLVRPILFDRG